MSAQSPNPFPTDGQRPLSPQELYERMQAQACLASSQPSTKCEGQVFVGIFFDGTGNNMDIDYYGGDGSNTKGEGRQALPPEKRKHTNVVKLLQAYPYQPQKGYISIYLPGVGTPFPEIGDSNTPLQDSWFPNLGAAAAAKGQHRILWALLQLLNAPHQYVRGEGQLLIPDVQAKTICDTLASSTNPLAGAQRRMALQTWQGKLTQALRANLPRLTQINLSVFGFSRGAAEARVFVNWLMQACEHKDGGWRFAGMALNLQFLGLFDTVASVGLANLLDDGSLAGHQSWADNSLQVHPAVRQCLHLVAGHELRACFPLDSVRIQGSYPANVKEVVYPGAHSDVGGGYAPGALGVGLKPQDNLSILPGRDMYDAARIAGVPLPLFSDLKTQNQDLFISLSPSNSLVSAYNAYLKDAAVAPGPVEAMSQQHMRLYHSFRFKHRLAFDAQPMARNASAAHQRYLRTTQNDFMWVLQQLGGAVQDYDIVPVPVFKDGRPLPVRKRNVEAYLAEPGNRSGAEPANSIWADIADKEGNPLTNERYNPQRAARIYQAVAQHNGYTLTQRETKWLNVAAAMDTRALTPGIEHLFNHHVHDSLAGFIDMQMHEFTGLSDRFFGNRLGLAKYRTVFKGND